MANVLGELFKDQAAAIREGLGAIASMKPTEFPDRTRDIVSILSQADALVDEINGEIVNGIVVTFIGAGGVELCQVKVSPGKNCPNPASNGVISTPAKTPTNTEVYTFSGWSLVAGGEADSSALLNITEPRTVYAAFTASTRYYTIRFYDGKVLLKTEQLTYGESSTYVYEKVGGYFNGWVPAPTDVVTDMDCYGDWTMASFAADSLETIIANSENGVASKYYSVGDEKELELNYADGTSETILIQVAGFDKDPLYSDASKYAGMTIIAKTALETPIKYSTKTPADYSTSNIHALLQDSVMGALPAELQNGIKEVLKHCSRSTDGASNTESFDMGCKLWAPSAKEIGASSSYDSDEAISVDKYSIYGLLEGNQERVSRVVTTYGSQTAVSWYTRTAYKYDYAVYVNADGSVAVGSTAYQRHVVFGFCV